MEPSPDLTPLIHRCTTSSIAEILQRRRDLRFKQLADTAAATEWAPIMLTLLSFRDGAIHDLYTIFSARGNNLDSD